ncbi:hypothetical protein SD78_2957 [Bacillus badius]|nr:hypothetical protein SD78_2957 [Bacillus badius]
MKGGRLRACCHVFLQVCGLISFFFVLGMISLVNVLNAPKE